MDPKQNSNTFQKAAAPLTGPAMPAPAIAWASAPAKPAVKKPGFWASLFPKKTPEELARLAAAKKAAEVAKKAAEQARAEAKAAALAAKAKAAAELKAKQEAEAAAKAKAKAEAIAQKKAEESRKKTEAEAAKKAAEVAKKAAEQARAEAKAAALAAKAKAKTAAPAVPADNVFTALFGKKEVKPQAAPSILETILKNTSEPKPEEHREKSELELSRTWVKFAHGFVQFTVVFTLLTAGFFYTQNIDRDNAVLSLFGIAENPAMRLHAAAAELDARQTTLQEMERKINVYKRGYNNKYEKTIEAIVAKRTDWLKVLDKISEVTLSVYEKNDLAQYIKYTSFSFEKETGRISVTGTLTDPLGKNLTKLVELEEAFRYYPRVKENPKDETPPYFSGVQELRVLNKTLDQRTGKYTSNFQLSFSLND